VVLDSALAGTSLSWSEVAPALSGTTTVVTYDRAGFGWSEKAPHPRRVDWFVTELRRALGAAGIEPPYVLVGHSYGGWVARLFAATHPDDVAGLVLVDAPHPREWMEPGPEKLRRIRSGARLARLAGALAAIGALRILFRLAPRELVAAPEGSRITSLLGKVPGPMRPVLRSFWVREATLFSLASLIENAPGSAELVDAATRSLGDRPLVVLTAGNPSPDRVRDQEEVCALSSRGRHVVAAASGHWIPLEEPGLVVDAVREVVSEVRESQSRRLHPTSAGRSARMRSHSE
jgi:pimeloyl-ACP methyl ester carboxylesterase